MSSGIKIKHDTLPNSKYNYYWILTKFYHEAKIIYIYIIITNLN